MITFLVINGLLLVIAAVLLLAGKFLSAHGECSVSINDDKSFKVSGGDKLLAYLDQKNIFIPSGCGGKATCGLCKIKVLSGDGAILPTEETFMTGREKEQGVRLACQVKVRANLKIRIPGYLLGAEQFEARVSNIRSLTHDIKLITLDLSKTIDFRPGQYVQLKVPGTDEYRAYSISTPPSVSREMELIIRFVPGGLCSTCVHKALQKGDKLALTGPFGDFYLRENSRRDIVVIGGGCGMAPIHSMIRHLAEKGMPRRFLHFFGARTKSDLFFTEELKATESKFANYRYIPALSESASGNGWNGEVGLITHVAEKCIEDPGEKEAYLCGPPAMIDAAIGMLTGKGMQPENIYCDKF